MGEVGGVRSMGLGMGLWRVWGEAFQAEEDLSSQAYTLNLHKPKPDVTVSRI